MHSRMSSDFELDGGIFDISAFVHFTEKNVYFLAKKSV